MALLTKELEQEGDAERHLTRWSLYVTAAELEALSAGETPPGVRVILPPSVILSGPHMVITLRRMPQEMADRHQAALETS